MSSQTFGSSLPEENELTQFLQQVGQAIPASASDVVQRGRVDLLSAVKESKQKKLGGGLRLRVIAIVAGGLLVGPTAAFAAVSSDALEVIEDLGIVQPLESVLEVIGVSKTEKPAQKPVRGEDQAPPQPQSQQDSAPEESLPPQGEMETPVVLEPGAPAVTDEVVTGGSNDDESDSASFGSTSSGLQPTPPGQEQTPPGQEHIPPGQDQTPPGQGGTPPGLEQAPPGLGQTPPGQGEIPPGQGNTPPGQGGTPPGQGGTPPGQEQTPPGRDGSPGNDEPSGGGKGPKDEVDTPADEDDGPGNGGNGNGGNGGKGKGPNND